MATLSALATRPDELPEQLIVVDNSPGNNLSGVLGQVDLPINYSPTCRNEGFAAGVNRGLKHSRGECIILLNPDARPEPGCLAGLADVLDRHEDIAVAGPVLLPFAEGGQAVPSATRRDPFLLPALVEYTALHRMMAEDWLQKNYFVNPGAETGLVDCAMVQGACLAFRRSWLEKIGNFDEETFFLYWEETDFCQRVRRHGGRVVYCPQLTCRHLGGASMGANGQDVYHFWRSFYGYHRKHQGQAAALLLRFLLIPGMASELWILMLLSRYRHKNDRQLERHICLLRRQLREQFRCSRRQGVIRR